MNAYLDSSVVIRLILGNAGCIDDWADFQRRVCSDLVEVESLRTLDRLRVEQGLSDVEVIERRETVLRILRTAEIVETDRGVLRRASGPFPVVVRTLDAIHLSAALAWQDREDEQLVMATHDRSLARAARSFGMETLGVGR